MRGRKRRERGFYGKGTVEERSKNRWTLRYPVNGERRTETVTAYSEAEARDIINTRTKSAEEESKRGPKVTIGMILDMQLAFARRHGYKDIDILEQRLRKHMYSRYGDWNALDFTTAEANRYIDDRLRMKTLKGTTAHGTINRETSALRHGFKLAAKEIPGFSHMPHIEHLSEVGNRRTGFLEYEQYQALLRELPEHSKMVLCFAVHIGTRRGELLAFEYPWVDWNDMIIRVPENVPKNEEEHIVPIYGEMIPFLERAYQTRNPNCPYIFQYRGERLKDVRSGWKSAAERVGIPNIMLHDMRRTAARFMERAGVPRSIIKYVGGWKADEMLNRYLVSCGRDAIDAGQIMTSYFGNLQKRIDELGIRSKLGSEANMDQKGADRRVSSMLLH